MNISQDPAKNDTSRINVLGMTTATVLATILVILQLALVPTLFPTNAVGIATPLLPVALIAAWGTARDPIEIVPALFVTATGFGSVSTEQVGWFLIALLPTAVVAITVRALPIRTRHQPAHETQIAVVIIRAAAAAAVGASSYLAILTIASGEPTLLPTLGTSIGSAAAWSTAFASVTVLLLHLLQPRRHGLFG